MVPETYMTALDRAVRDAARRGRLSPDDTLDFSQSVQVRLLETGYDALHRFAGRSSLRTYLNVVASRMLLDWLRHTGSRWRPSAAARRHGPFAIALERLVERDGYTTSEAVQIVSMRPDAPPPAVLWQLAAVIRPRRAPRFVDDADLARLPGPEFEDPIESAERRREMRRARRLLARGLSELDPQDRFLIHLRYQRGMSVQAIATMLGVEAKGLYRRFDRTLRGLRLSLETAGRAADAEGGAPQEHAGAGCEARW
jgi:RNA polymerase sigma factor (sigma-70 family)